jgi:hypothetical protein
LKTLFADQGFPSIKSEGSSLFSQYPPQTLPESAGYSFKTHIKKVDNITILGLSWLVRVAIWGRREMHAGFQWET